MGTSLLLPSQLPRGFQGCSSRCSDTPLPELQEGHLGPFLLGARPESHPLCLWAQPLLHPQPGGPQWSLSYHSAQKFCSPSEPTLGVSLLSVTRSQLLPFLH